MIHISNSPQNVIVKILVEESEEMHQTHGTRGYVTS